MITLVVLIVLILLGISIKENYVGLEPASYNNPKGFLWEFDENAARDAIGHAKRVVSKYNNDYYGQGYFKAGTTKLDESVMDPMYNLRVITKELLDMERDIREKQCIDCVMKQLEKAKAQIEEAIKLDKKGQISGLLADIQNKIHVISKKIENNHPFILLDIQNLRKYIGHVAFGSFVNA